MAQVKIYPSTQAQVQAVQNTVDEINGKITTPTYQVKTVIPSNAQQTVQADTGYTALSGVVVNPIAALMPENLEDFIMRNGRLENFSILVNGSIPSYACYGQIHLAAVYGELSGAVGGSAFQGCASLQSIDTRNITNIENYTFQGCASLQSIDTRNVTKLGISAFSGCASLQLIDMRKVTVIENYTFQDCTSLQLIDMRNVTKLGNFVCQRCKNLQLIDCTSCTTPPVIQSATFTDTNDNFKVVVATDAEKTRFRTATNWSVRASQIYTIAEIEAIVGMTYDEYYLQCFGHARFD